MNLHLPLGRKKKEISAEEIYRLAALGFSVSEIAQSLRVGKSTLQRKLAHSLTFKAAYKNGRAKFKSNQQTKNESAD